MVVNNAADANAGHTNDATKTNSFLKLKLKAVPIQLLVREV